MRTDTQASSEWNSRQRVMAALDHREPDRIPIDLNPHADFYVALKRHLGLAIDDHPKPNTAMEVVPDPRLLEALGVDLISVKLSNPCRKSLGRMPGNLIEDEWGVGWRRVEQAVGGSYLEPVYHPLAKATLVDLTTYAWPDPNSPGRDDGLRTSTQRLFTETNLALVGRFGGPIVETALCLLGWEEWLIRAVSEPFFAGELLDRITDVQIALDQIGLEVTGPYLAIFKASGEDLGMQMGPLYSRRVFEQLLLPRLARRWQAARRLLQRLDSPAKVMLHSCGGILPFIPALIEAGVEVLDPIQPRARGMDGRGLKCDFGGRLTFHGGIDIQEVLPYGTPAQVEAEVRRCLAELGPGGGYILAPAHAVQPDVPPANLVGMCEAAHRWGRYPLDLVALTAAGQSQVEETR